jgi:hypothetical protein
MGLNEVEKDEDQTKIGTVELQKHELNIKSAQDSF